MMTLILGGARSGKSRHAQKLATGYGLPVLYVATATASDAEMAARIAQHQEDRPAEWRLRESPLELAQTLREEKHQTQTILVDCLTLWLNNHLFQRPGQNFCELFDDLVAAIAGDRLQNKAHIIFVANEVGLGIIPMGEVTRQFVDEAGRLNQLLAKTADEVVFVAAGLPLVLKHKNGN